MKTTFLLLAALALGLVASLAASGNPANLVLIVDASNSMNKPFGGDTRISAARAALSEILTRMPEEGSVALLVFGHRINYKNEVESCQDISFLFPLAPFSRTVAGQMIDAAAQIVPQGMTPLADSLTQAANAIDSTGQGGAIILISDGEGNCSGMHVEAAQRLALMNPPIALHIIGLDLEVDASETLRAMALETGGGYWGVTSTAALIDALFAAVTAPDPTPTQTSRLDVPPAYACYGITNIVYGTEGDDVIYGTPGNDLIFGLGGNDFMIGLGGTDVLIGGPGNDILEGGDGGDYLDGGEGDDLLFAGSGNDIVCGGPGNDSLEGETGDDVLDGGPGCDVLLGGKGVNTLYASDGLDVLLEGAIVSGSCPRCPSPCVATCPSQQPVCSPTPSAPADCALPPVVKTVNEGETIQLRGAVSDWDCNVLSILWQASAGTFNSPTSLNPLYTAPMISGCGDLEVSVTLTAVDTCGASGTDSFRLRIVNVNHAPTASAGPDVVLDEGQSVLLTGTAQDPDSDALSIRWVVAGAFGTLSDPTTLRATFHAPPIDACSGIEVPVTLMVTDACGATACDTMVVRIRNVNRAPIVDLGPDFAVDEGQSIRWTPVVSDPDCDALSYCWTATAGAFDRTDVQNPTFAIPFTACCDGETLVVTLTVTDPCGLSTTDSVTVHVRNVNRAPLVDLGANLCVLEGCALTLCPIVNDPDGDALTYAWSVSAGRLDSTCVATPVFVAPMTDCNGLDVTVTLTVTDPCGLSATDVVVIHIEDVNRPPVVVADP